MAEQEKRHDTSREEWIAANKVATLTLTILCSIISFAYILEVVKKTRTLGYTLVVIALAMIPVVLVHVLKAKDPASRYIKSVVGIGYAAMYAFVILTTTNPLVFTYAFPMLIVITLYDDVKYIIRIGVGVIIVNIAAIIGMIAKGALTDIAVAEINEIVVIVILAYLILVSKTNEKFQKMRTEVMREQN
ncbi:MAG: hypothetical protein J6Y09_04785, partial [Lachnospiraceae bacterium]|nr:hypothetical protein [Lachnospiraceae bacterium]